MGMQHKSLARPIPTSRRIDWHSVWANSYWRAFGFQPHQKSQVRRWQDHDLGRRPKYSTCLFEKIETQQTETGVSRINLGEKWQRWQGGQCRGLPRVELLSRHHWREAREWDEIRIICHSSFSLPNFRQSDEQRAYCWLRDRSEGLESTGWAATFSLINCILNKLKRHLH